MSFFSKLKQLFGSGGKRKTKGPLVDVKKRFDQLVPTGQGSMSKVYKTRDSKLGRMVCLKILDKGKLAKFEARFVGLNRPSEGAICMTLRHKNVVQTFEYGTTTTYDQYIIMELVEGLGLNYLVENRKVGSDENKINYLIQAADGLEYVHKQGYMHRDICPRNMMVTNTGVVKLIDFGLAIPFRPEFCKPGNRTGTPDYLAPEVIRRVATDFRVDMFALGVTAYEIFTGTFPWERSQSIQTLQGHVNIDGKDPRDIRPDLDERTARFLIKAIARNPRDRFQNNIEFRDALKVLLRNLQKTV